MNRRSTLTYLLTALAAITFIGTKASAQAGPQLSVTPDTIDFGTVSIGDRRTDSLVIENAGNDSLLILEIIPPESSEYRLTSLGTPFFLEAMRFVRVGLELRARDTGCTTDRIIVVTDLGSDTVLIRRCATVEQIMEPVQYYLPFPDTETDRCFRNNVRLAGSQVSTRLYGIYSDDPDAAYFHSLTVVPYDGLELPGQPVPQLPFEFCPKSPGSFQARFRCVTDSGIFIVATTGTAFPKEQASVRRFYLDTVSGNVGDAVTLRLIADPPLTVGDKIDSIELTIDFDRTALFLQDVRRREPSEESMLVRRTRIGPGTERVVLLAPGGYVIGQTLLLVEFTGLSTGKPSNVVRLSGRISGLQDTGFSDGMILLEGCTLGASGFSRRVAVESLTLDLSGTHLILRYSAAEGAQGEVAVIDASGTEVTRFNLEPGNDALQELRLPLEDFFPGLYGLLIEVADDRVIVPFISPR